MIQKVNKAAEELKNANFYHKSIAGKPFRRTAVYYEKMDS